VYSSQIRKVEFRREYFYFYEYKLVILILNKNASMETFVKP
jgi:hypothetical protein